MKTRSLLLLSALLLTCAAITTTAQQTGTLDVPRIISYQGLLSTSDGAPLPTGTYDIIVTLYADEAGTQPLWQSTYNTSVHNGIFSLYLGSGNTPLPPAQQMNRPLWIGTSVNGSPQLLPLTPLAATPYALNLPDRAITTAKLADGAVTAEKIGAPYVAGIALNGKTITGDGTVLNIEVGDGIALAYDEETKTLKLSKPIAAVQGDGEKGAKPLDFVSATENWIGRQNDDGTTRPNPPIIRGTEYNTIAGGFSPLIDTLADYSSIVGGYQNVIDTNADYSFIGGGEENTISYGSNYSTISGGQNNSIQRTSSRSTIGGGTFNVIDTNSLYTFIGGGQSNIIDDTTNHSTIAGGHTNKIGRKSRRSTIGGGFFNFIDTASPHSFIGGGEQNFINRSSEWSTISGGHNNTIHTEHGFIGGGHHDTILGIAGVIGGGWINTINGNYSTIGGGFRDTLDASWGTIVGGNENRIVVGDYSVIGGGDRNKIRSESATIGGGRLNVVGSTSGASNHSVISGGDSNIIDGANSFIGGGRKNIISGFGGVMGGGRWNVIVAEASTIAGGFRDTIEIDAFESFIGGGSGNRIQDTAYLSVISGGTGNIIDTAAAFSSIGGGSGNFITPPASAATQATLATIPGGDNLIAQSWAQTVIGGWNIGKGSVPFRYQGTHNKNNPIFIIGNGEYNLARSNAFEVSYNGHSIVYDVNNTGAIPGGRGAARGATYQDNIVYAWATISMTGSRICNDFGVEKVQRIGVGHYRIELNAIKESGVQADSTVDFSCASVTATISSGLKYDQSGHGECKFITTSLIGTNNIFDVYINENWITPQGQLSCRSADAAFTFKVTGHLIDRPPTP